MSSGLLPQQYRQFQADLFLGAFATQAVYLAIGRPQPWADDANVPAPTDAIANTIYDYRHDLIAAKKITTADVVRVIPRHDWASNTVYAMYDHGHANLASQTFFVMTSGMHVYKCLDNANGVSSTIEPTGTSNTVLSTGDGYKWKYLFTVSASDQQRFLTTRYIPVRALTSDDGSAQYDVQTYAATSLGALDVIRVVDGGTGYNSNTIATITGDGSGANTTVTVSDGQVTAIDMNARGQHYTTATVTIVGTGTGANAEVMIPPPTYHGSNAAAELYGTNIMIAVQLEGTEGGVFPVDNDFRRLALVTNWQHANGQTANASLLSLSTQLTANLQSPPGVPFELDEPVEGQTSHATGIVVDWNANGESVLRVTQTTGTFANGELVVGQTSGAEAIITGVTNASVSLLTGQILYVEHREPMERDEVQVDEARIVIRF